MAESINSFAQSGWLGTKLNALRQTANNSRRTLEEIDGNCYPRFFVPSSEEEQCKLIEIHTRKSWTKLSATWRWRIPTRGLPTGGGNLSSPRQFCVPSKHKLGARNILSLDKDKAGTHLRAELELRGASSK